MSSMPPIAIKSTVTFSYFILNGISAEILSEMYFQRLFFACNSLSLSLFFLGFSFRFFFRYNKAERSLLLRWNFRSLARTYSLERLRAYPWNSRTMNGILKHSSSHCGEHYLHLVDNIPFFFCAATIRRGGGFKIYFAHTGRKVCLMPFQNYDAGYKARRQERMREREKCAFIRTTS